ncbi:MAG: 3-phosphoglycerate dehydrogenase, partial [Oscillospiraceae bacterium]
VTANAEGVVAIPHLGASTPESEDNCAVMAAQELRDYLENGNIKNSVNLPNLSQEWSGICRLCIIHKNIPAMLASITTAFATQHVNVENMTNKSKGDYAYTVVDLNDQVGEKTLQEIQSIAGIIKVRVLTHD